MTQADRLQVRSPSFISLVVLLFERCL